MNLTRDEVKTGMNLTRDEGPPAVKCRDEGPPAVKCRDEVNT